MYAQDETPAFRRRLWMILWFIVVVVVLWTLVWFIFLRDSAPKVSNLKGSNTSQNQSSSSGSNSSSNSSSSKSSTPSSSSTSTSDQQLANTGAGNVLIPFAVASVAGTALYYIRLRRKLLS